MVSSPEPGVGWPPRVEDWSPDVTTNGPPTALPALTVDELNATGFSLLHRENPAAVEYKPGFPPGSPD
jgi:hypothetical protein